MFARCRGKTQCRTNRIRRTVVDSINAGAYISEDFRQELKEKFIVMQHNWAVLKENDCDMAAPYLMGLGSGGSTLYLSCLVSKTEARIDEMKERLHVR